ncbi:hypothetical protein GJAV_G00081780 [Gymnothorax javanicus]|nr:hypothetical protein GJAV_G00081780 [Gymnothorax javanicus]
MHYMGCGSVQKNQFCGGCPNMSRHAVSAVGLEGSEPVSLSFTNELEKGNAKIITPRSHSACLSFPIVSETYPVVFHAHYHHQPFSSPGFQSLDPGQAAYQTPGQRASRNSKIHSAIFCITQSSQKQRLGRGVKERLWTQTYSYPQMLPESASNRKRLPAHRVNLQNLSAYGGHIKSADMEKVPKLCCSPPPCIAKTAHGYKKPLVPVVTLRQKSNIATDFGCALNGVNPKQFAGISVYSPDYYQGFISATRLKANYNRHQKPSLSSRSPDMKPKSKMGFLSFSRSQNFDSKDSTPFTCDGICTKEENHTGQSQTPMGPEVDIEGVYGWSFNLSKANRRLGCRELNCSPATRGAAVHPPAVSPVHPNALEIHLEASNISVPSEECKYATEAEDEDCDYE